VNDTSATRPHRGGGARGPRKLQGFRAVDRGTHPRIEMLAGCGVHHGISRPRLGAPGAPPAGAGGGRELASRFGAAP
jgi:hypothetical protein